MTLEDDGNLAQTLISCGLWNGGGGNITWSAARPGLRKMHPQGVVQSLPLTFDARLPWNPKHDLRNRWYVYAGNIRCLFALPVASFMAPREMARSPATDTAPAMGLVRNADASHDEYSDRLIVHHWCTATLVHSVRWTLDPVLVATTSQEKNDNRFSN